MAKENRLDVLFLNNLNEEHHKATILPIPRSSRHSPSKSMVLYALSSVRFRPNQPWIGQRGKRGWCQQWDHTTPMPQQRWESESYQQKALAVGHLLYKEQSIFSMANSINCNRDHTNFSGRSETISVNNMQSKNIESTSSNGDTSIR